MAGAADKGVVSGSQKKDKKKRIKDAALEPLAQSLKGLAAEEQISTLLSKYGELLDENKRSQATVSAHEKMIQQIQKEKDKVDQDYAKAVLSRSKLESLCRELQRQMKTLKDENVLRLKEEEEKRREISNQFNTTLNEITRLMEENTQKNNKLREENNSMAERLKALIDHNDKREDHIEKVIKQKEIENQLSVAKMSKFQYEFTEQKGILLSEKKQLLEEIAMYQEKLTKMSANEVALRNQLASYSAKYEEFQAALDKSNKLFKNFKGEMDEMTKCIKRHEKETKCWREKWDSANKALLQMVAERTQMEAKMEAQSRQNTRLQSLCRALQQQMTECREQLKKKCNGKPADTAAVAEAKECSTPITQNDNMQPCPVDCRSDTFDTASEDETLEYHLASEVTPKKTNTPSKAEVSIRGATQTPERSELEGSSNDKDANIDDNTNISQVEENLKSCRLSGEEVPQGDVDGDTAAPVQQNCEGNSGKCFKYEDVLFEGEEREVKECNHQKEENSDDSKEILTTLCLTSSVEANETNEKNRGSCEPTSRVVSEVLDMEAVD